MIDLNAECVRKIANWSLIKPHHKFEKSTFDTYRVSSDLPMFSPKTADLLRKIKELDEADYARDGKYYKHFIFSDVKQGGYGSKIITSALIASGYHLAYNRQLRLDSDEELLQSRANNFALLCSTGVYDKTISVKLKKQILGKYNQRPENINGELVRIIVMDSGYKEGIDLFDVKYVHIFEPQTSKADEKQVIGRGTRTCGQKGLQFQPNAGWPLEVYVYDVEIPQDIAEMFDAKTLYQLYVKYSNIDLRKIAFANALDRLAIVGSVDYELNKNIHDFRVLGEEMDINKIFDDDIQQGGGEIQGFCLADTCGSRASKKVPLSNMKFATAFFAIGRRIPEERFETAKLLRGYFCELMKTDAEFCAALHELHSDIKGFVNAHSDELINVFKNKLHMKLPRKYPGYLRAFVHTFLPKGQRAILDNIITDSNTTTTNAKNANTTASVNAKNANATSSANGKNASTTANTTTDYGSNTNANADTSNKFLEVREQVRKNFLKYKWPKVNLENMCGGSSLVTLNPTQEFVSHYFTPENPTKGMLLYHSVGTGKTCTAIATASSTFESAGYTVLWVTRTTLKSDIWKNMFDQVCSAPIRGMIESGKTLPVDLNSRMRLLSNNWSIRPMSYKQFTNLIEGKNDLYKALVKKNGEEDPLRKTLLIIDEAHKLYGGTDLSSIERPNMYKFKKALHRSYAKSGADSVKVLLMTATPYTNDPMELVKLINLLKQKKSQFPEDFDEFADVYLDDTGNFTKKGHLKFLNDIAGHISYLNREKDARQFAQPVIMQIKSTMSQNGKIDMAPLYETEDQIEESKTNITYMKEEIKQLKRDAKEQTKVHKEKCKGLKKQERTDCLKEADREVVLIKAESEKNIAKLNQDIKSLTQGIKDKRKQKTQLKKTLKEDNSQYGILVNKCAKKAKKDNDAVTNSNTSNVAEST